MIVDVPTMSIQIFISVHIYGYLYVAQCLYFAGSLPSPSQILLSFSGIFGFPSVLIAQRNQSKSFSFHLYINIPNDFPLLSMYLDLRFHISMSRFVGQFIPHKDAAEMFNCQPSSVFIYFQIC